MRCRALAVPRAEAERVRLRLRDAGWLRADLGVSRDADRVYFPLVEEAAPSGTDGTILDHEFSALKRGPSSYRDRLTELPPEVRQQLPRAFDVVGDVVLIRLPDELVPWKEEVGRALLEFVPHARQVGWDQGVHGTERRRRLVPLAGGGGFVTRHRENGLDIEVDLERAYFSPRLAFEHQRVAAQVRAGERVYDLCCGVGPFTLAIARDGRAREVVSVDLNPDAIGLLRKNLDRLGLGRTVRPIVADLKEFLADAPAADRAILNLPHEGIKYLTSVGSRVERGGTLHYYEIMERSALEDRGRALVDHLGGPSHWQAAPARVVHPYAPTSDLVALTLTRHRGVD